MRQARRLSYGKVTAQVSASGPASHSFGLPNVLSEGSLRSGSCESEWCPSSMPNQRLRGWPTELVNCSEATRVLLANAFTSSSIYVAEARGKTSLPAL